MDKFILHIFFFGLCKWNAVYSASPTISVLASTASISETTAIGTSVLSITASDSDGDTVTYSVASGGAKFVMNGAVLTTSDTFDYETSSDRTHNVVIRKHCAMDKILSSSLKAYYNCQLNIIRISVKNLVCSDADATACTISIQSGDDATNKFAISGTSIVTSANAIDYESLAGSNYVYTLIVVSSSDSISSATATVYVTITAVNEITPGTFSTSPSTISIAESVSIGTSVCQVSATDGDTEPAGALQYSIVAGDTNGDFGIDAVSGIIYTAKTIDYESHTSYPLTVQATDAASSPLSSSAVVTVTITNVNDNPPICTPNYGIVSLVETSTAGTTKHPLLGLRYVIYQRIVPLVETSTAGTTVHTLSCSDADGTTPTYSITSGNSDGIFAVSTSGVITIDTGKFRCYRMLIVVLAVDYDTGATAYSLAVQVTDGTYSTTVTVAVTITASNEATPSFSSNPTVNLAEDSSVGTAVYTYTASDSDAAPHGIASYEITTVTNSGITFFTIDHSSGAIQLAKTLDYESQTTYAITVVATDGGNLKCGTTWYPTYSNILYCNNKHQGFIKLLQRLLATLDYETTTSYSLEITVSDSASPARSTIVQVEITITNVNEATPVFTSSGLYSITFDEDTATATTLVTVSASDTDTGDTIVYGFVSAYTGFVIIPSTGVILLTESLNYETATTHSLLTTATDGTRTTTATVSLTVNDVNETPVFGSALYSPTIDENKAIGSSVVQVSASDVDASTNGVITYSLVSGDGSSYFVIDASTGVITTSALLDYEEKTEYNLIIRAADGASPSLSATCLVNITVNDLNDNAPLFIPNTFTLIINENVTTSTVIKTLDAADADSSVTNNNVFEYTLTTNTIPFSVGTTNGQVTTNTALDRETTASEEAPLNTYLFTISACDIDEGDNSRLTYIISAGDSNNDFKIESGVIFTAKTLDRETIAVYNLVIEVSDNGSPTNTATVTATVTISDINDNRPSFTTNFAFTVSESLAINGNVGTISASDADVGVNAALTYSIQQYWSSGTNPFTIISSTGVISIGSSLDRETLDTYHLLVRVADGGTPSLSSDLNITVSVSDVNDNAPVFGNLSYSGTVVEGAIVGTTVLTVSASDADAGSNAIISFSIDTASSGGTTADQYFTMASATGVITVKQATDNGSPQLTTSVSIYVSVTDINDNNPVFSPTFYDSEISYLVTCSSSITTLTATDADSGDNGAVSYYIISSDNINFDDYFEIGSSTDTGDNGAVSYYIK
ncbi:hypothetical protein KUTeg_005155 [Tegillarca granosa]|uniref:Cadherin domain-containing protein n=1 Tax=Tegillarca granosa TaxID=220873 RepID=A0ABQ9FKP6_TEGGR|nr:hypothetical protein KUTeg_005155 [Tegillarca granosa]